MEGPELVNLKEKLNQFIGLPVKKISGYAPVDLSKVHSIKKILTWGKHLIIVYDACTIRVHFMLFGTYSIDAPKPNRNPTLKMVFESGETDFYTCQVKLLEKPLKEIYDWRVDLMDDKWDGAYVLKLLEDKPEEMICDVLLDQDIFAGLGNIMKNEVLYLQKIHPETLVKNIPVPGRKKLIAEARDYAFKFYEWRKDHILDKNLKVYHQKKVPGTGEKVEKAKTGRTKRFTYFAPDVQRLNA
jgi:endonuclease-8